MSVRWKAFVWSDFSDEDRNNWTMSGEKVKKIRKQQGALTDQRWTLYWCGKYAPASRSGYTGSNRKRSYVKEKPAAMSPEELDDMVT